MASFEESFDIPRYLGSGGVPRDRVGKYSVVSYQAMYLLLEHQAERFHAESRTHQDVLGKVYQLFSNDPDYRKRVKAGYPPHAGDVTQAEADELMKKLGRTPWSEVGRTL